MCGVKGRRVIVLFNWHSIRWVFSGNHYLANKAYFSAITVKNIYESFTHKMATKASWHRNYVTLTLYITISLGPRPEYRDRDGGSVV